jgi:hypothetical protein
MTRRLPAISRICRVCSRCISRRGKPGPRGGWPAAEVFRTYLEQLAPHRATLLEARALLVIGRASPEGTAEINQELAGQRIALVERLLRAALGDAAPPIHAWARAERDALAPEKFRRLKVRAVLSWDADVTSGSSTRAT